MRRQIPTPNQKFSDSTLSVVFELADMMVQMAIPRLIIRTDMYLLDVYRLPRRIMPIIMFARREPALKIMCSGSGMLKFSA